MEISILARLQLAHLMRFNSKLLFVIVFFFTFVSVSDAVVHLRVWLFWPDVLEIETTDEVRLKWDNCASPGNYNGFHIWQRFNTDEEWQLVYEVGTDARNCILSESIIDDSINYFGLTIYVEEETGDFDSLVVCTENCIINPIPKSPDQLNVNM